MFAFLRRFAWFGAAREEHPAGDAYQTDRLSALRALDHGEYQQAETLLSVLLASGSERLDALERATLLNKRGVSRIKRSLREEARADFAEAISNLERFAPALTNLGNMLLEDDRTVEAIALYERAILADETYAGAYYNLGIAYKRQGRTADSVRALRRADRPVRRGRFF